MNNGRTRSPGYGSPGTMRPPPPDSLILVVALYPIGEHRPCDDIVAPPPPLPQLRLGGQILHDQTALYRYTRVGRAGYMPRFVRPSAVTAHCPGFHPKPAASDASEPVCVKSLVDGESTISVVPLNQDSDSCEPEPADPEEP